MVYTPPPRQLPPLPPAPPTALAVAACDAATAARALAASGCVPAVLNFANATQRGGGYLTGATAQEEDLCLCVPGLYPALVRLNYPLDPASVPATTAVVLRQSITLAPLPPLMVVILTAAALDLRFTPGQPPLSASARADMRARVRAVLFAATSAGCRDLVLGPWGCGVFRHDATEIATLFAEALGTPEWQYRFSSVTFAMGPRGVHGKVSQIFVRVLSSLTA